MATTASTVQSANQIISAFGSQADAVSLVRNIAEGATSDDVNTLIALVTDLMKITLYYAELVGTALITNNAVVIP